MRRLLCAIACLLCAPHMVFALGVDLVWPNSDTPTSFNVYRRLNCTGPYVLLVNVPGNELSHTDTSVLPGTLYCYAVTAVRGAEESLHSPEVQIWTPGLPLSPGQPTVRIVP